MLITFKSKAYPNVMMYQDHAKRILDLLHKDSDRGVITAEEAGRAVNLLENEIEESRKHQATDEIEEDVKAHPGEQNTEHEAIQTVTFSARAFPLLEMLRAARDQQTDVLWGV
ncbi:DUF1840 domain-containing protein [Massilia rhizosphaerae]|jgi:hypothetical protein|uniref:DUF1840 domain-containing protein n=1 Tax=Massilia rhizosphaerae TaxID=2784389 RepID=UPI0018DE6B07|nr:DUF1840 domain-containing protein [Massilia rhizosphaerae]